MKEEIREFIELIDRFREEFQLTDFVGIFIGVLILSLELAFLKAHPPGLKRNRKVERAKELGHVVKAHKIKDLYGERREHPNLSSAIYEYEVNGKEYRYYFSEYAVAPQFLELYWISRPKNVFPYLPRKRMLINYLIILCPAVVGGLIICYFRGLL